MEFRFHPLRFEYIARERVHFSKPGNMLRGALGYVLPAALFAPGCDTGPSGFADAPRPFVLRVRHLEGRTVEPGEPFQVGVNLFDLAALASFTEAFADLGRRGLGPGRGRADLQRIAGTEPVSISLTPTRQVSHVHVDFLTPTELKSGGGLAERPEFATLFARIRDRVAGLRRLYGGGAPDLDFRGMGERAAMVRLARCEVQPRRLERRSSRTGQTHAIGGFLGFAEYEGELGEFLPWLEAARCTGVGRQTVWGKGEIGVTA